MNQQAGALDVAQELNAQPRSGVRAFDESGDVGHDHLRLKLAGGDDLANSIDEKRSCKEQHQPFFTTPRQPK
jgi:hypothetical protein